MTARGATTPALRDDPATRALPGVFVCHARIAREYRIPIRLGENRRGPRTTFRHLEALVRIEKYLYSKQMDHIGLLRRVRSPLPRPVGHG